MKEIQVIIDKKREAAIVPDGIIVINEKLKIIVFNEAAVRITGISDNEALGKDIEELSGDLLSSVEKSFSMGTVFTNMSIKLRTGSGGIKSVLTTITPVKNEEKVLSVVVVFRDTKEMLSMAESIDIKTKELLEQKNRLDAIFNSNIEGTFTIDENWIITSFNKSAEKITGVKSKDAIGKRCRDIFNSKLCGNGCHMETTLFNGKPTIGNELLIKNSLGEDIPIRVNTSVLKNSSNEKIGAVETFIDLSEIKNLESHIIKKYKFENIVGKSKAKEQFVELLESVSETDTTVLVTGESGTGKEIAARAIHLNSSRSKGPFIAINCSAFAETLIESELFGHEAGAFTGAVKNKTGRFELAKGGTLFLDEIADLSLQVQTKLLRVIENFEFERVGGNNTLKLDARIICATNKDLSEEILKGNFREDLFYRINVINIHLPPLRERTEDIPELIEHFIEKFNQKFKKKIKQLTPNAIEKLIDYPWPGNIRELENVLEHAFVLAKGTIITEYDLPKRIMNTETVQITTVPITSIENAEKELITATLKKFKGNKKLTSLELGINPSTLWRKMKRLGIVENRLSF